MENDCSVIADRNHSIDQPGSVRPGEELNELRLLSYLRERIPGLEGSFSSEQFPAGFSNLTYLLRVGDREFVLRRPPRGAKIKTAHDMGREYRILSALHPVYKKVPRPLFFCQNESVLGAPFFVMERITGVILRNVPPKGVELSAAVMHALAEAFVENLVGIHEVNYEAAGLSDLGQPAGYVQRQIEGWTKRYVNARTDDVPQIERLAAWLSNHLPADSQVSALIHNDYKYDNLVLAANDLTEVLAVLDWEMATIGDPLMDLGTTLGYWVDPEDSEEWQRFGFGLTRLPGNLRRREVFEHYLKRREGLVSDPVFYYAYGLLKIAVIVQQIYFRYRAGLTKDRRFSELDQLVQACGNQALRALEKQRIDSLG